MNCGLADSLLSILQVRGDLEQDYWSSYIDMRYTEIYKYTYLHKKLNIYRYKHILNYIQSATKVLHNIIILDTPS